MNIVTLCCGSTEEARLLIPSLGIAKRDDNDPDGKITDSDLDEVLTEILAQDEYAETK